MFWKHEVVDINTGSGVMYEFQMAHHLIKKIPFGCSLDFLSCNATPKDNLHMHGTTKT